MRGVEEYIDFYNDKRPHGALQYKTPDKMEKDALSADFPDAGFRFRNDAALSPYMAMGDTLFSFRITTSLYQNHANLIPAVRTYRVCLTSHLPSRRILVQFNFGFSIYICQRFCAERTVYNLA